MGNRELQLIYAIYEEYGEVMKMNTHSKTNDRTERIGIFYGIYVLAMLIFGTNGYLVAHISIQSSQIVLLRTLIGGTLLTVLVFLRGGFDREAIRAEWKTLILGGMALGLNWVALFEAYRLLNVSLATLIYYAGPMLVLLFSPLLLHEKLTAWKLGAVIAVAGGLVCISGSIALSGMNSVGLLTAAASALFYASLIVFNKRIVRTPGLQTAGIELDVAFVVVLIYLGHGYETTVRTLSANLLHDTEGFASVVYVALAMMGVAVGAQFCQNILYQQGNIGDLYSTGTILLMNVTVGVKVFTGIGSIALLMLGLVNEKA